MSDQKADSIKYYQAIRKKRTWDSFPIWIEIWKPIKSWKLEKSSEGSWKMNTRCYLKRSIRDWRYRLDRSQLYRILGLLRLKANEKEMVDQIHGNNNNLERVEKRYWWSNPWKKQQQLALPIRLSLT